MSQSIKKREYIYIFLILLMSAIIYLPYLPNQFLGKDEEIFSAVTQKVENPKSIFNLLPHSPIVPLSMQIIEKITSYTTFQFVINWLILTLNSILFFILINKILTPINKTKSLCAFLLSLLLLAYPLSIYSFSFISARGGMISVLFSLLTFLLFIESEKNPTPSTLLSLGIIISFLLAILSHFISAILSIPIIAYILRTSFKKNKSQERLPYTQILTFLIVITITVLVIKKNHNVYYHYDIYQDETPSLSFSTYLKSLSDSLIYLILPTNYFPIKSFPNNIHYSIVILFTLLSTTLLLIYASKKNYYTVCVIILLITSLLVAPVFINLDSVSTNTLYYILTLFLATIGIITLDLLGSQKSIRFAVLAFLVVLTGGILWLSIPLLREIKNPEILWFSSASNNKSNPEPWRYLGRIFLKKAEKVSEPTQKSNLLEASLQCWNEILSHYPEDLESLISSAKCKRAFSPLDSEKTLDIALSLDPVNKNAIREKIYLYQAVDKNDKDLPKLQKILYNTYLTSLLLKLELSNKDIDEVCQLAILLRDEIFLEKMLSQFKNTYITSEVYQKFTASYKNIKAITNKLKIPTLNDGKIFTPPADVFYEFYRYKNIKPLAIAWSNYEYKLDTSNKEPIINIGIIYAKENKIKEFIHLWRFPFENDNDFWEKLSKTLIAEELTESALETINQTSYSDFEKNIRLLKFAIENKNIDFAKDILKKTQNFQLTSQEKSEIEQLKTKIFKEVEQNELYSRKDEQN